MCRPTYDFPDAITVKTAAPPLSTTNRINTRTSRRVNGKIPAGRSTPVN